MKTDGISGVGLVYLNCQVLVLCPGTSTTHFSGICLRNGDIYELSLTAPVEYFKGTIILGELVWEVNGEHGNTCFSTKADITKMFSVYDLVALAGFSAWKSKLETRQKWLAQVIATDHVVCLFYCNHQIMRTFNEQDFLTNQFEKWKIVSTNLSKQG